MKPVDPDGEFSPVIPDDEGEWLPANLPGVKPSIEGVDQVTMDKARAIVHGGQSSYFPNMATAAGKELVALARKGMNLGATLGDYTPGGTQLRKLTPQALQDFSSPEAIAAAEKADQPTFDAPGGKFAQIVTDVGASAPIGGPIEGMMAKAAASPLARSLLARAALSQPARSGVSNAVTAAATADPEHRVEAALEGGALGTGLGTLQSTMGRSIKGLVQKSDDLTRLEGDVSRVNAIPGAPQRDLFVPVSQGANKDDLISSQIGKFYKSALPYAPFVESMLTNQAEKAGDVVRGTMLQTSAPEGHIVPAQATNDMQLSTHVVKQAYDSIYNNLRKVNNITVPKDFATELKARIQKADPQIPESDVDAHVAAIEKDLTHQAENSKDGKINGWNLKNTRDNTQALNSNLPMAQRNGLTNTTKDYIDQIFSDKLQQAFNLNHQSTKDILTAYKANAPNYENFRPLNEAVNAWDKKTGKFPFGTVAPKANDFTTIQGMDQNAFDVLGGKPAQINQAGRILTYPIIATAARLGGLAATGGTLLGATGLATKSFQKGLYGDTALQKTMQHIIETNPKLAAALGYTARSTATQAAEFGRD